MKLVGSRKSKINENENGANVPSLEITEVILVHCNIVNYQQFQESCMHLSLINRLVNY